MQDLIPLPGGWPAAMLLMLAGLATCFGGSKLVRFALGLSGFVIVGTAAAIVTALVLHSPLWTSISFLIFGLIGGAIAGALIAPGIFLLGLALGHTVSSALLDSEIAAWIIAIALGALFLVLSKRVLVAATAGFGAIVALEGAVMLLLALPSLPETVAEHLEGGHAAIVLAVVWVLLALAGYRVQLEAGRKKKKEEED